MTAVLNANPCPNPDPTLPCFGLPAPRPTWALPEDRRDSTQTDPSFRQKGEHEYSALRGMAWSDAENLFYVTDNEGIFRLTPNGVSTFVARPAFPTDGKLDQSKAIAFYTVGAVTQLLVGHRDGSGTEGYLISLNPATGEVVREIPLTYPPNGGDPVDSFGGLLGLAQHPTTGVLYGIRKTSDNFGREIVTIDPSSGATTLVGSSGDAHGQHRLCPRRGCAACRPVQGHHRHRRRKQPHHHLDRWQTPLSSADDVDAGDRQLDEPRRSHHQYFRHGSNERPIQPVPRSGQPLADHTTPLPREISGVLAKAKFPLAGIVPGGNGWLPTASDGSRATLRFAT